MDKVTAAIEEFVRCVRDNEPGTRFYAAWQQESDPTRFVYLFLFNDEHAHAVHGQSAAVWRSSPSTRRSWSQGRWSSPTSRVLRT